MQPKSTILRKLDGFRFAAIGKGTGLSGRWELIQGLVAEEFRVRPDDVGCDEGEDEFGGSIEFLTIDSKRVAFLDEGDGMIPVYQMIAAE